MGPIVSTVAQKLDPIVSFVVVKLKALPKPKSQHKHGEDLLLDMLPQGKRKNDLSLLLPLSRTGSPTSSVNAYNLDTGPTEVEATEQAMPEIGGLERQVYEVPAGEVAAVELWTPKGRKSAAELQGSL